MLVLTRRIGESVVIGDNVINISVLDIQRGQVRLGIDAPREVTVHREEIYRRIQDENNRQKPGVKDVGGHY